MKIEIKERQLTAGNRSLYLEYYEKGFRKKENLHLYLLPDGSPGAKKHNREAYERAVGIRAERVLNPPCFDKTDAGRKSPEKALTWMEWNDRYIKFCADSDIGNGTIVHKIAVKRRIEEYLTKTRKRNVLLKDVTPKLVSGLFDYLRNDYHSPIIKNGGKLSENTLCHYERNITAMFNKAVREELIGVNPVRLLAGDEHFRKQDSHRAYLTVDELKRFMAVETKSKGERNVQTAFVFSCMTALRISDVRRLRWCDIKPTGNGKMLLSTIQQKTKGPVSVPMNDLALCYLPERSRNAMDEDRIFHLVKKPDHISKYVRRIAEKAKIEKDITFHCARHTAATLAISAGAELYTVSKILGHKDITSTQIYAKVDMDMKFETVNLTDGVFD